MRDLAGYEKSWPAFFYFQKRNEKKEMFIMSLVKTIGRTGIEWFVGRDYSLPQIAKIYGVSSTTIYQAVRALYGADWKNTLKSKKELNHEKRTVSDFVRC